MNRTIAGLTVRQLFGQKRTLLIVLIAIIPIAFTVLFRLNNDPSGAEEWVAERLFAHVLVGVLLPFIALIFGTAALGTEFEDGTAVYLLSKPLPRWRVVASKLVVAWGATVLFIVTSSLISAPIALQGSGADATSLIAAFVAAEVLAAFVYCAVFLALSIVTAHALLIGLLYVFIWEAALPSLFTGTRYFSIHSYSVGFAHWVGRIPDTLFKAPLGGVQALLLLVVVGTIAVTLAVRWLRQWEIGETA